MTVPFFSIESANSEAFGFIGATEQYGSHDRILANPSYHRTST